MLGVHGACSEMRTERGYSKGKESKDYNGMIHPNTAANIPAIPISAPERAAALKDCATKELEVEAAEEVAEEVLLPVMVLEWVTLKLELNELWVLQEGKRDEGRDKVG